MNNKHTLGKKKICREHWIFFFTSIFISRKIKTRMKLRAEKKSFYARNVVIHGQNIRCSLRQALRSAQKFEQDDVRITIIVWPLYSQSGQGEGSPCSPPSSLLRESSQTPPFCWTTLGPMLCFCSCPYFILFFFLKAGELGCGDGAAPESQPRHRKWMLIPRTSTTELFMHICVSDNNRRHPTHAHVGTTFSTAPVR